MYKLFINRDNKIRSGFKLLLFSLLYITFANLEINLIIRAVSRIKFGEQLTVENHVKVQNYINSQPGIILMKTVDTALIFIIIIFLLKSLDNKNIKYIGFHSIKGHIRELLYGLSIGTLSMAAVFFVLLASGNIDMANSLFAPRLTLRMLSGIILYVLVAVSEEVMCRGYVFSTINEMKRPYFSAVISSFIFAALHLGNPNVKILGIVNIFLIGILFSYMCIKTNDLWMPIGYHFAWNYFQGNIFGFPVSGQSQSEAVYIIESLRENLLTGGAFGPEAGILTTIVIMLGFLVVKKIM